jgi:hypothetical protein
MISSAMAEVFVSSGDFCLAGPLNFPMGEPVQVSATRAGPAASFWIRAFDVRHLICDAALDASGGFAAYDLHLL